MNACLPHREFLVAVADRETRLVPLATLEHVEQCADCSKEIETHRLLSSRLRAATEQLVEASPPRQRARLGSKRVGLIAAASAGVLLLGVWVASRAALLGPDPVQAAVMASSQPLQMQSTDPSQVSAWCLEASGRGLPAIQVDGMQVVGARMDRVASTDVVTVAYSGPAGERVSVSWLEGRAPPGSGVEAKSSSGRDLLIVHSHVGTAVITGSSSAAMWETAAAIESAT